MVAVTPSRPGAASSSPRRRSVPGIAAAGPPKFLPVLVDPLVRHWKGTKNPAAPIPCTPKARPVPPSFNIGDFFSPLIRDFSLPDASRPPPAPRHSPESHPTCPQPGRGSRRAGCPRRRPRSSAGSTRRGLRSTGQRGGTTPGLAPHNSPGVGSQHPKTPMGAPGLRISAPKCFETLGLGFQHPKTRLGAIGLGFRAPKTKPEAPKLGFGTPRMETSPRVRFWSPKTIGELQVRVFGAAGWAQPRLHA